MIPEPLGDEDAAFEPPFVTDALLGVFDDPDELRARSALRVMAAVAAMTPDAIAPLADALLARVFSPGPVARRAAVADALSTCAAVRTVAVAWYLEADDADARQLAARALAAPRHLQAQPALGRRLVDEREDLAVRLACAAALAGIADLGAVDAIEQAATSPRAAVRRACADALGKLGRERRVHNALVRLCDDGDADVRVAALSQLLGAGGAFARRAALSALGHADAGTCAAALLVLARHGAPADVAVARSFLDAREVKVRRAARGCLDALAV